MKESVIYQEILLEGEAKGEANASNKIVLNMLRSNMSIELIAQFTGLSLKEIQKIQKLSAKKAQPPKSAKTKRSPKN